MTYLGTFWVGVLCGTVGGLVLVVVGWWGFKKQTVIRWERVWHWSQTQGDK